MSPEASSCGQNSAVDIQPIDPRTDSRWETAPIHNYRVIFWGKGAAYEFDIADAADVHEVIGWAEQEARTRGSTYTLFARVDRGETDRGLIWLAGVDPTVWSSPNFEREHPSGIEQATGVSRRAGVARHAGVMTRSRGPAFGNVT
jgi:hypothetical protein